MAILDDKDMMRILTSAVRVIKAENKKEPEFSDSRKEHRTHEKNTTQKKIEKERP